MRTTQQPTVRRQELGEALRALRTKARFSLQQAARVINCSQSKLSRVETGHRNALIEDIASLLGLYRADHTTRTRLLVLAREAEEIGWLQSNRSDWAQHQHTLITLESKAEQVVYFDPVVVPGLLQTGEYAAAVMTESQEASEAESAVTEVRRRSILARRERPTILAIIDESVLRRPLGGRDVLRHQLAYLLQLSRDRIVSLHVIPSMQRLASGAFTLLRFPDRSPVIVLGNLTCSLFLEQSHNITVYERTLKRLLDNVLDQDRSYELISSVAGSLETQQIIHPDRCVDGSAIADRNDHSAQAAVRLRSVPAPGCT